MDTDIGPNPEPLFRPVKRRKFLRRRELEPEDTQEEPPIANADSNRDGDLSETQPPTQSDDAILPTDVARRRRLQRARKGGIEFSTTSRQTTGTGNQAAATMISAEDLENEKIRARCDRFTAHTGQTVDVDKHMMAFIETEMAKRYQPKTPTVAAGSDGPATSQTTSDGLSTLVALKREPASLGKLHEIDLGQESKLQNIARTEAATRRLVGEDGDISPAPEGSTTVTGKDGRSWRNRKRRNSEDIERDRLVEEVLRESKLDVYDEPEGEAPADDLAADDRVAEQFRREFLDAIQSRRRVARARNTKTTVKPDAPRGPKLGGSRSARAAMRERQEKAAGRK